MWSLLPMQSHAYCGSAVQYKHYIGRCPAASGILQHEVPNLRSHLRPLQQRNSQARQLATGQTFAAQAAASSSASTDWFYNESGQRSWVRLAPVSSSLFRHAYGCHTVELQRRNVQYFLLVRCTCIHGCPLKRGIATSYVTIVTFLPIPYVPRSIVRNRHMHGHHYLRSTFCMGQLDAMELKQLQSGGTLQSLLAQLGENYEPDRLAAALKEREFEMAARAAGVVTGFGTWIARVTAARPVHSPSDLRGNAELQQELSLVSWWQWVHHFALRQATEAWRWLRGALRLIFLLRPGRRTTQQGGWRRTSGCAPGSCATC